MGHCAGVSSKSPNGCYNELVFAGKDACWSLSSKRLVLLQTQLSLGKVGYG